MATVDITLLEQKPEQTAVLDHYHNPVRPRSIVPDVQDCPVRSAYVDGLVRKYRKDGG
jgi:hypothetical protein